MPPIQKGGAMPATGKIYPDWVQAQRARGTTVKKKGDTYYLYKRTSRRVPGKKYPQPVDTYIGVITPDGIVESGKRKISLAGIEVKEDDELYETEWKVRIELMEEAMKRLDASGLFGTRKERECCCSFMDFSKAS